MYWQAYDQSILYAAVVVARHGHGRPSSRIRLLPCPSLPHGDLIRVGDLVEMLVWESDLRPRYSTVDKLDSQEVLAK